MQANLKFLRNFPSLLITAGSLFLFTIGLSHQEIIRFDSRFYLFALEMQKYGLSWFPTTYHQAYPDYPATSTILIYLLSALVGGLNKLIAVLPSAFAAAMTVMLTYKIGRLQSKRWAIFAVCFLFLNINFFAASRSLSLDMYPTLITTACFYLLYTRDIKFQKSNRTLLILPLLLLGFAFRGPIGLVIPTGVVCSYYLLNGKIKQTILFGTLASLLLAICIAALLYAARDTGGIPFMHDVWRMEIAGRMNEKAEPFYFYLVNGLTNYAISFPIAFLVMTGLLAKANVRGNPKVELLVKLTAWSVIVLVGMSIPGFKKTRYIMPMMPAIALLAAYPFVAASQEKYFQFLRQAMIKLFFIFPLLLAGIILSVSIVAAKHGQPLSVEPTLTILVLSIFQLGNFAYYFYIDKKQNAALLLTVMAAFSFTIANIIFVEPVQIGLDQSKQFVQSIEVMRHEAQAPLVFYKEAPDNFPIKYLVDANDPLDITFADDLKRFNGNHSPAFFVTTPEHFTELTLDQAKTFHVVGKGNIGHRPVIVFTNIQE